MISFVQDIDFLHMSHILLENHSQANLHMLEFVPVTNPLEHLVE